MTESFKNGDVKIFAGPKAKHIIGSICDKLGTKPGRIKLKRFSDGEIFVQYQENVRNRHVVIIQNTGRGDDTRFLKIMIDAARRSAASRITAIIPYFGFARQERKDRPRTPITGKVEAKAIDSVGPSWLVFCDLHSSAIAGFFETPSDHVYARPEFLKFIHKEFGNLFGKLVLVAPDVGASKMCQSYAKRLGLPIALIDKRRSMPNKSEVVHVIGNVRGKHVLLIDDMIDTAGSVTGAADALLARGALSINAIATHGILSGPAISRIEKSPIKKVYISDSILPKSKVKHCKKISIISLARMWGEVIQRIETGDSLSELFEVKLDEIV